VEKRIISTVAPRRSLMLNSDFVRAQPGIWRSAAPGIPLVMKAARNSIGLIVCCTVRPARAEELAIGHATARQIRPAEAEAACAISLMFFCAPMIHLCELTPPPAMQTTHDDTKSTSNPPNPMPDFIWTPRKYSRANGWPGSERAFGLLALGRLCWPANPLPLPERPDRAAQPFAVRAPHHPARAKRSSSPTCPAGRRMWTSRSQTALASGQREALPFEKPNWNVTKTGNLLASLWKFSQHGQSGIPVSELFASHGFVHRRHLRHSFDGGRPTLTTAGAALR